MVGFGLFAYVVFGDYTLAFNNMPTTLFSLMQMALGNLDHPSYDEMKQASKTWPLMFLIGFALAIVLLCASLHSSRPCTVRSRSCAGRSSRCAARIFCAQLYLSAASTWTTVPVEMTMDAD